MPLMLNFVLFRLARIPLIALGVVTIIFVIFKLVPGDEAVLMAGATASQADIDLLRQHLGLDRPVWEQYATRMLGFLQADLGYSSTFRGNPLPHIVDRIPATLALMISAILTTVIIGLPAGIVAAVYQNRWPDYVLSSIVVALLAIPNFWLGLMLIVVLSVEWGWLPSFGFSGWASLVMPTIALAARLIALVARMTRGVMLEELRKDYVRTARAKGLDGATIVWRHVLRNALIPTVTVIGLQMGYLLGGSVVVERLFAWPGIGDLMINAIGARDYTLVQGITILFVVGFLLINLVVEILYVFINPRLRHA
jgi:ABC-type dipeptide/oligopeptide/nickel transport system permease component